MAEKDAEWAAAVLEGTVVTRGAWSDSRQRSRQNGGGGGNKTQRRRPTDKQQERRLQQHHDAGTNAATASTSQDTLAAYRQPGPRSTARVAHCQACDVWVPRRAGDWEVHTAGIRHRRQLLSLKVHGQRNNLVLSAFENAPDSEEAAQRLVGRAAADFGLGPPPSQQQQQQQQAMQPSPAMMQTARQLRTEALKQLLNMFGVGQLYSAAGAGFGERLLASQLQQAAVRLEVNQAQRPPQPLGIDARYALGAPPKGYFLICKTGAELAAVAHHLAAASLDAGPLAVVCAPPMDAPRAQHARLAAALPLLLSSLKQSRLASLQLRLPDIAGPDHGRLAQLWQSAWQHTLPALRGLLASSAPVRDVHLILPGWLRGATNDYRWQLEAAAAAAPLEVRMQVLMGLHPRLGRCSLLQLLPLTVVREVLDLAAPLQPCAVRCDFLVEWSIDRTCAMALPFYLAALLLLLQAICTRAQLLPRPKFLAPSRFSGSHPKNCLAGTVFVSTEQWWTDELFTGTVAPLGHMHLETCWPLNQVMARKQKVAFDTLQHLNPSTINYLVARLMNADQLAIKFTPPARCGGSAAPLPDLMECRTSILRSSLTPLVCNKTGGTVAAQYVLPSGSQDGTSIDCRWRDQLMLDTSQVPASGRVQFVMEARAFAYSDPVPSGTGLVPRSTVIESFLPGVLSDSAGARCSDKWCGWNSAATLTALAWTNGVNYTSGIPGTVVRNATGSLWQQQLPLNLTAQALTPGWNKITLQGKAPDRTTKGVQTCSLSTFFELVPPCPPTPAPFMTHVWQDSLNNLVSGGNLEQSTGANAFWLPSSTTDQPFLLLSFDLSFLSSSATAINATLYLKLVTTVGALVNGSATLNVFDASVPWASTCGDACPPMLPATTPCVAPGCQKAVKVGSGQLVATRDTNGYVELRLSATAVSQSTGKLLQLAVALPRLPGGATGTAIFSSSTSSSPPFLLMSASCPQGAKRPRRLL